MAILTQTQKNLVEVALDAPLSADQEFVIETFAKVIAEDRTGRLEVENYVRLCTAIKIAERVNKIKEGNG